MIRSGVDYRTMRALVALSNEQLADYVWHFLKGKGADNVQVVHSSKDALNRLRDFQFSHFFVGHHLEEFGGPAFARFIRMSSGRVSEAPIILLMSNPDHEKVAESRDSGVSEIMGIPFTGIQLDERLKHISKRPKEFIRTTSYIGPNRRRVAPGNYSGPERRAGIRVAHLQSARANKVNAG